MPTPTLPRWSFPETPSDIPALTTAVTAFSTTWKPRAHELSDADVLLEALTDYEKLVAPHGLSGAYGYMLQLKHNNDLADTGVRTELEKTESVAREHELALAFFDQALVALGTEQLTQLSCNPKLEPFRHHLEQMRDVAPHILPESEEALITRLHQPAKSLWYTLLAETLSTATFPLKDAETGVERPHTLDEALSQFESHDKSLRDAAAQGVSNLMKEQAHLATAELNAYLSYVETMDTVRKYERPDQGRHIADGVDHKMVDALRTAVRDYGYPLAHQYYALKAKALGQSHLAYHERSVSIVSEPTTSIPWERAVEIVRAGLARVSPQFVEYFTMFLENGRVDAPAVPGKRGGAACFHNGHEDPTYLFLNYTGSIRDVLTLAHEVGHGIHNELVRTNQRPIAFGTPLSTAALASTFCEHAVL